ncbi:MAG: hypothetical protein LUE11_02795 [Clostridia bacterium]|nr:hypothetical protein [Clostridia bacterium]
MNELEKRLSAALRTDIEIDPTHINRTILDVQEACAAQPYRPRIGFKQFMLLQARFYGVRMWLWQGLVLTAMLTGLNLVKINITLQYLLRMLPFLLGCCGVAAITATVPMLYRSIRYQMHETECACYFSGVQLLWARLLFMGIGVLLTLIVTVGVVIGQCWLGTGCAILYVCVPCLMTACGYLAILAHTELERLPVLGSVLSGSLVLVLRVMLHFDWYPQQFGIGSGLLCLALALLCVAQVRHLADGTYTAVS